MAGQILAQMRFTVVPSPSGGYHVRMLGSPAPRSTRAPAPA